MTADFARIPVSSIHVGERQRPIDQDHAEAIAASMAERGLINPITVRRTPNAQKGATPYTLVAGGHRLTAAKINEWTEIDAMVVTADAAQAVLIEISENLIRNDLSALNRALFVAKYRETIEEMVGNIHRGRPKKGHDGPIFALPGKELSQRVQERLGISHRTYKRISQIAVHLHQDLRQAVRATEIEDDQSKLLKLAKLDVEAQLKLAAAMREGATFKAAMALIAPKAEPPALDLQGMLFARLSDIWSKADEATRRRFLDEVVSADDWSNLEDAA
ncbi:ParB N-terminal domain-containing protein [Gellertiella hungarica]|uniref:ParB family chromosome partitioning protein n=1 Tax=Gellertiella hungarica TaxID=1572859 RepID=A0A7W6J7J3_9HYPH|nr:ParB N-terminal domain-containing protein [Gellertiella hungarica]MBB4066244.1 ParB family chromosome partitioning protein [Gellertiella hungarica]